MTILKGTIPSLPTRLRRNCHFDDCQEAADRLEQLETLARYHAIEVGCECLDCYQIREAEQYANGGTEND